MTEYFWAFTRAFIVTVIFMPAVIKFLKQSKEQAVIRKLGPDHQSKAGTPSMGGALFIAGASLSALIGSVVYSGKIGFVMVLIPILAVVAYAIIGGIDDALKMIHHADDGFRFIPKLLAQTLCAVVIMIIMWIMPIPLILNIPFIGVFNLGIFTSFSCGFGWWVGQMRLT